MVLPPGLAQLALDREQRDVGEVLQRDGAADGGRMRGRPGEDAPLGEEGRADGLTVTAAVLLLVLDLERAGHASPLSTVLTPAAGRRAQTSPKAPRATAAVNSRHTAGARPSAGPSGFLLSRTKTRPWAASKSRVTSTQSPPPPL